MSATKPTNIPWLGQVPDHWEVKRIKSVVVRSENGAWGDDGQGDEHDVYCYRAADFDTARMVVASDKLVKRHIEPDIFRKKAVRPEHLLIEKSGGGENVPVGRVVRSLLHEPAVFSNFLGLIEVDTQQADSNFIRYQFWHLYDRRVPWRSIKQTTGLQNLDTSSYFNERLAFPPLPEQRAIATYLDERTARIDGLVARQRRLVQLLKEKRQALITRAVNRGLNPNAKMKDSGVPWLGEVPVGWEVKRIGHLCNVVRGSTPRPAGDERYFNGSAMPWITVSEITGATGMYITSTETSLTEEGVSYSRIIEEGTLLLSNSGATLGVPRVAGIQGCLNDGCAAFLRLVPQVERDFLYYFFESHTAVYRADTQVSGQPNLNTDLIGSTLIAVPPVLEQRTIVSAIQRASNHIDTLVTKVEQAVERLQEYRTALISAAVTGKVRVAAG